MRKSTDKVQRLLDELRGDPNEVGLRRILNVVESQRHAKIEYFGLGKAVKKIFNRELSPKEQSIVARLS
jgi:hypothetical protein